MTSEDFPTHIVAPTEAPGEADSVVADIVSDESPDNATETPSEIDDPSLTAVTQQLQQAVALAHRRRESPLDASDRFEDASLLILASYTAAGLFVPSPHVAGFPGMAAATGVAGTAFYKYWADHKCANLNKLTIPDGYGLQCLYAGEEVSGQLIAPGDAVVAVAPRKYEDAQQEPSDLARRRLRDALRVCVEAGADRVAVPQTILQRAQIGLRGFAKKGEVLESIAGRRLIMPDADETCLVLGRDAAATLAEELEGKALMWQVVLRVLQRRYPSEGRFRATVDDPTKLLPVLHHYALPAMNGELLPAQYSRLSGRRIPFTPMIDTITDPFDPRVLQHTPDRYDPDGVRLSKLAAGQLSPAQRLQAIERKLTDEKSESECSEIELLYAALQVIKRQEPAKKTAAEPPELGGAPEFITLPAKSERRRWHFGAALARVALTTAVLLPPAIFANQTLHYFDPPKATENFNPTSNDNIGLGTGYVSTGSSATQPIWKVSGHGLPTAGYYEEQLSYDLVRGQNGWVWYQERDSGRQLSLPTELPNAQAPHLNVEQWTTQGGIDLPVKVGTRVGALQVQDTAGHSVAYQLALTKDGSYMLSLDNNDQPVHIRYELVGSPQPVAKAIAPLSIDAVIKRAKEPPNLRVLASQGPRALANYMHDAYRYDNSPTLNRLVNLATADQLAAAIDHAKACNCNVCMTNLAIAEVSVSDEQSLAAVFGYRLDTGRYITAGNAHAWVTDGYGEIIDATPAGSLLTTAVTEQQLDAAWQKEVSKLPEKRHFPNPLWPLVALGAVAIGGAEAYFRFGSRSFQAASRAALVAWATRNLSFHESYGLLNLAAYGGDRGSAAEVLKSSPAGPVRWQNIPDSVLQAVAKGGMPGAALTKGRQRSLRRTARLVLSDSL